MDPEGLSNSVTAHRDSSLHSVRECDIGLLCEEVLTVSIILHERAVAQLTKDATSFSDLDTQHSVADAIRRIIMNLVHNSFKYTESGLIRVHLDLQPMEAFPEFAKRQRSETQILLLRVADTGREMSAAFVENDLFVPFSQVSNMSPGSGLGFSPVHAIVKTLEGNLEVQSVLAKGTEVTIKIPLPSRPVNTPYNGQSFFEEVSHLQLRYSKAETRFCVAGAGATVQASQNSLRLYMHELFGFHEVAPERNPEMTFISADDAESQNRLTELNACTLGKGGGVIVLHQAASTETDDQKWEDTFAVQHLVVPTGPRKLAKALQALSEKIATLSHTEAGPDADGSSKSSNQANADFHTASTEFQSPSGRPVDTLREVMPPRPIHNARRLSRDGLRTVAQGHTPEARPALTCQLHFSKSLPVRKDVEPTIGSHGSPAAPKPGDDVDPWVLCVDDNSIYLSLLLKYCKKVNLKHVMGVEDGLQAFHAFQSCERRCGLVFMDLTMPVCDGFKSTAMIREYEQQQRNYGSIRKQSTIIAVTGLASAADQEKAFAAGVNHFVTKPLWFKDFKILLQMCGIGADDSVGEDYQKSVDIDLAGCTTLLYRAEDTSLNPFMRLYRRF